MVAVAIGGAAVIGGATSVVSGNKAAKAQKDASAAQVDEWRRQYDQTRADFAPWRTAGANALTMLTNAYGIGGGQPADLGAYGGFTASPGYQFRQDEAAKAIQRSAAATGQLQSGATLKALDRYSQGIASDEYTNWWNRLAGIAGVGQAATEATASAGQNATSGISNAIGAAGNARASSYANTGSAINGTLNNVLSSYLYSKGWGGG